MIVEFSKAVALLLALCLMQGVIGQRWTKGEPVGRVLSGLLFGGICVIGMLTPIEVTHGVIFDARSVILSMSGLFGGPITGGIAAVIAGGYRLWLGGGGAAVGVSVVISCTLLGLIYRYAVQRSWIQIGIWQLLAFGVLVHLFEIFLFTFLPDDVVKRVMESVALPLVLTFTPATAFLGLLLQSIDRHIQTGRLLAESESRFRDVAEVAGDWIWETDSDLRFTFLSPRFFELMPYKPDDIIGKTREEYTQADREDENWRQHFDDLEHGRAFRDFDFTVKTPDEQLKYFRISGKPIFDDGDNLVGYRGTGTDISEHTQTLEALKDNEKRFRTIVDNLPIGVNLKDMDGRFLLVNRQFETWYGVSEKELLGKTAAEVLGESGPVQETRLQQERKLLETGEPLIREEEKHRANGLSQFVVINKFLVSDAFGKKIGFGTASTDITEFKKAEEALRVSEARLQGILEIAPGAVIVIGGEQKIQHFNQGAERIFGYTYTEMVGQSLDKLLPPEFRKVHAKYINEFADSPEDFRLMDQRNDVYALRKDGSVFPATASLSKLKVGEETFFIAMLQDITDRRQAEETVSRSREAAEIANRSKSEFLANMSHELRTPLNAIIGFSEMMAKETFGPLGNEKNMDSINSIHEAGNHLFQIIGDILDISKIEAGEAKVEEAEVNVGECVDGCINMIVVRAEEAEVNVVAEIANDLPDLRADQRHLKQIVLNLLSNAVKFTPAGGKVTVAARLSAEQKIEIEVTDTGIGIDSDDLSSVVQPFTQVAKSSQRSHEGTGLGLPICKSLMELHGGTLTINSELGNGTSVTVSFPAERTIRTR